MLENGKPVIDEAFEHAGICLQCGEMQSGCEPDARNYECESCGARRVFGVAEAIIMGTEISDDLDPDELMGCM